MDEEGNVFQLLDKGETKPIEVEHLPGTEKTGLEVLLEASLKEGQTNGKTRRQAAPEKESKQQIESSKRRRTGPQSPTRARPRHLRRRDERFDPRGRGSRRSGAVESPPKTGRGPPPHRLRPEARPQRALQLQLRNRRRHRRLGRGYTGRTRSGRDPAGWRRSPTNRRRAVETRFGWLAW